jgi:hypothetical protein
MTKKQLSERIGIVLIVSHVVVVFLTLVLFFASNLLEDEVKITLAVIGPTLATYGSAAMAYISKNHLHQVDTSPQVSPAFMLLSWLLPAVLVGSLIATIIVQDYFRFGLENYALALGALETGVGAYVLTIARTLFEASGEASDTVA